MRTMVQKLQASENPKTRAKNISINDHVKFLTCFSKVPFYVGAGWHTHFIARFSKYKLSVYKLAICLQYRCNNSIERLTMTGRQPDHI